MCGIAGIWTPEGFKASPSPPLHRALGHIAHRGPDAQGSKEFAKALFGHSRLSIIDTTDRANQPMCDVSERYCLVFNGEIYNYREIRKQLAAEHSCTFATESDTEVLLKGLIYKGKALLNALNGFFAFAFYDSHTNSLLCARDRYGIKPFYYSETDEMLSFGSTLTAVMALSGKKEVSRSGLCTYLQLSYLPDPITMIEGIHKLPPGYLLRSGGNETQVEAWYKLPSVMAAGVRSNSDSPHEKLKALLRQSVQRRLVADVPLGTFLSGGLDSSVITLLAKEATSDIPAFSIGFPDQPFFDESAKARRIAKHIGVRHEVFEVREKDIEAALEPILSGMDEPFADSSAVLVNILSQRARQHVKVTLSGDGADELLGGYNKHRALLRSLHGGILNRALRGSAPVLHNLPASRNHTLANRLRKIKRYSRGLRLDFAGRYLEWASFTPSSQVAALLQPSFATAGFANSVASKLDLLDPADFNSVLKTDMALVLAGDMLYKVDSMSMHRALEVRVPFLDHDLVHYVFSLPSQLKIDRKGGKKLLREAFAHDFPSGTFEGPKRGFEAPLRHWLTGVLRGEIERYLNPEWIASQGIFRTDTLQRLKRKMHSLNPGDAPSTLWAVLVFQHWWQRHLEN